MKNQTLIVGMFILAIAIIGIVACNKSEEVKNTEVENLESATIVKTSLKAMSLYTDSMLHAANHIEMTHHNTMFHHHDSIFIHHHTVHHHGDSAHHHPASPHTPAHHTAYDSLHHKHRAISH